jgi:hypothetical protein
MTDETTGEVDLLPALAEQTTVPAIALPDLAHALTVAEHFKREILRPGVDYGIIPGVKKPSLWKPGAERAMQLFGLGHRCVRVEIERDTDGERVGITYRCEVFKSLSDGREVLLATCEGYAGNDESKWKTAPWNTILKMADKRAFIGAVLKATGLSDFFTQDVEDYADRVPRPAEPAEPQPIPARAVEKVRAACAEAGFTSEDVEEMVIAATGGRTDELAEVLETEYAALRDAKAAIVARKQDETPAEPEFDVDGDEKRKQRRAS